MPMPRPANAIEKAVKIPMPLGKNAHRARTTRATHSRGQRRQGSTQGGRGAPNVSPAPHLHALTCHHVQRPLTRRLHSTASRSSLGLERETHASSAIRRCARIPSGRRRNTLSMDSILLQPGAPASQPPSLSQFTILPAASPSPSHDLNRESVVRIDRLLSVTQGQISTQVRLGRL